MAADAAARGAHRLDEDQPEALAPAGHHHGRAPLVLVREALVADTAEKFDPGSEIHRHGLLLQSRAVVAVADDP